MLNTALLVIGAIVSVALFFFVYCGILLWLNKRGQSVAFMVFMFLAPLIAGFELGRLVP